jgi:hypothetical protein
MLFKTKHSIVISFSVELYGQTCGEKRFMKDLSPLKFYTNPAWERKDKNIWTP